VVRVTLQGSNEEKIIQANRNFINMGSQPFLPSIKGIKNSKKVFTSNSLTERPALFKRLIIIGGGFVGLKFAAMYAEFGAEVTILQNAGIFLPKEDRDIADTILKVITNKHRAKPFG